MSSVQFLELMELQVRKSTVMLIRCPMQSGKHPIDNNPKHTPNAAEACLAYPECRHQH